MNKYRILLLWKFFFLQIIWFSNQIANASEVDQLDLGRSIYEQGIGRDNRKIKGTFGGSISLSGSVVACAGCHGKDGRGGGEAFIRAPDIRWMSLNKTFPARRTGGVQASYDRLHFAKVLSSGINNEGRKLDPLMPRLDLADDEIDGLIDYLTHIDESHVAGRSREAILGLMPKPGYNAAADKLDAKLRNCPAQKSGAPIAAIDMVYFDTAEDAITKLKARLAKNANVFVLAPYLIGWEKEYFKVVQNEETLTILPFSFLDPPNNSRTYFSFPGVETQIAALLKSIKVEGHQHLHIQFEPKDPLSLRLWEFALNAATTASITVASENFKKNQHSVGSAVLWLTPVSENTINASLSANEKSFLMLVPVLFSSPSLSNLNRINSSRWRVAYPYKFASNVEETWLTPTDAWANAACEFLSLVGEGQITRNNLPEKLTWGNNRSLPRHPNSDQLLDQVFIK